VSGRSPETVLVVGAGGLGAAAALALAAGGARRVVLADGTPAAPPDLAAQPLLAERDLGRDRAAATAEALARRFPALAVEAAPRVDAASAPALVDAADVVVEASNRFPLMLAVGDAAARAGRPLVHGAAQHWTAQLVTVLPGVTGCLRCLFEAAPSAAPEAVAPGPLAALAGALLGAEALRLLAGEPAAYAGALLEYEARAARTRKVPLPRRPGCAACGGALRGAPAGGLA
jgi:molybdopterin/thiamine biosynthesis adenylyltransferase